MGRCIVTLVAFFDFSPQCVFSNESSGSYSDPLDRQLQERVNITNFKGPILMNRRNEMGGVRVDRMRYMRWGGN